MPQKLNHSLTTMVQAQTQYGVLTPAQNMEIDSL